MNLLNHFRYGGKPKRHSQTPVIEQEIKATKIYLTRVYPCYTCLREEWRGFKVYLN